MLVSVYAHSFMQTLKEISWFRADSVLSCFVTGAALHICGTGAGLWPPQSLLHPDSVLQRSGFERQCSAVRSHELQQ